MPEKTSGVNVSGSPRSCDGVVGPAEVGDCVVLVYATFPDIDSADAIGGSLVDTGLAACVNLTPGVRSIYRWEGQIHRDGEVVMVTKTRIGLAARLAGWLRIVHPYTNPAVVVIPVSGGSEPFLDWIGAQTAIAEAV